MSDDVAGRMRALADAPWRDRGDAATQAALREGAGEIERLRAVLSRAGRALSQAEATAAVLRGRVDEAEAEAARRTDEVVAIGAALGREGATGAECAGAIRAMGGGR